MRPDFSPTAQAARLLATRATSSPTAPAVPPPAAARSCEWPRRSPAAPRAGIWQTLQAIQARHA